MLHNLRLIYMEFTTLIPELMVLSLAGSSLSIAAYSAFKDRNDDKKLLLIIASCFTMAFFVLFVYTFLTIDSLAYIPSVFAWIFYFLIFLAISSILGFIINRLVADQKFKVDELESAIDIVESSKNGLDSFIRLLESQKK